MAYLIGAHLKASFPYHFGIEKESNVRTLLDVVLPLSRFELKYSAILRNILKPQNFKYCRCNHNILELKELERG